MNNNGGLRGRRC